MNKIEKIKHLAKELECLFGGYEHLTLQVARGDISVSIQGDNVSYAQAMNYLSGLGAGKRNKKIFDDETMGSWTLLTGEVEGVKFSMYPSELPPTCHKETYVEKIPKRQTVDTGEFVEITKTRIVCQ